MRKQLSLFEYENNFLSEFILPCFWNCIDYTTIYLYGYVINRRGQIKNINTNKFMKARGDIYLRINPTVDGKKYEIYLHRVVACTFLKCHDRESYCIVNHIDGNKKNNHYTNLEWCNQSQNILHWHKEDKNQLKLL